MRKSNDLKRLEEVCRNLENENPGFQARLNFWCCGGCGHGAMSNNGTKQYIFAHEQAMDSAFEPIYETTYFDEDGNQCDYADDYVDYEEDISGRETTLSKSGLYFQHHIDDPELSKAIVKAFNDEGFLVEWDFSESSAIKIHP